MPQIATSALEVFGRGVVNSEGVAIDKDNYVYGCGRNLIAYKVSPDGLVEQIASLPEGSKPNGVTLDNNGDIIYCDLGKHAIMRLTQSGKLSMMADQVAGLALTLPNFATYDAEGNLFVSITSAAPFDKLRLEYLNPVPLGSLVRIRKAGGGDVVATGLYFANGTAIDPKEEAVYVLQSTQYNCLRIPMRKDGSFGKPEIYSEGFPALPDGMAFAADGTLLVTLPLTVRAEKDLRDPFFDYIRPANRILKIDTSGNWEVLIDDPPGEKLFLTTNCAFGGADLGDLYFANLGTEHFTRVRTRFRGAPLYHQR